MSGYPPRLTLSSGLLTVELLPDWGSKMTSLRTEPDGYDFLAPAPFGPHPPEAALFSAADAYGFDELFPGAYAQPYPADPWQAETIADHGDLWYRPWRYQAGPAAAALWTEASRLGWYFHKSLRFSQPLALEISYRVENRSPHPLYWLYCAHILCPYRPGVELELPPGHYHRLETFGSPVPERCPAESPHLLRPEPFPPAAAAFYVSDRLGPGHCLYHDRPAGKSLRLSWTEPIAYLELWYNRGGWTAGQPLHHVGLEPTTTNSQDLAECIRTGVAHPLPPGGQAAWTLTLAVSTGGPTRSKSEG